MRNDDPRPERLYANHFEVGCNAFEFLLDFGTLHHDNGTVRFHTGIVTSPGCADMLLRILQRSIRDYEKAHGPIPIPAEESE